jgi:hypothetical protein
MALDATHAVANGMTLAVFAGTQNRPQASIMGAASLQGVGSPVGGFCLAYESHAQWQVPQARGGNLVLSPPNDRREARGGRSASALGRMEWSVARALDRRGLVNGRIQYDVRDDAGSCDRRRRGGFRRLTVALWLLAWKAAV